MFRSMDGIRPGRSSHRHRICRYGNIDRYSPRECVGAYRAAVDIPVPVRMSIDSEVVLPISVIIAGDSYIARCSQSCLDRAAAALRDPPYVCRGTIHRCVRRSVAVIITGDRNVACGSPCDRLSSRRGARLICPRPGAKNCRISFAIAIEVTRSYYRVRRSNRKVRERTTVAVPDFEFSIRSMPPSNVGLPVVVEIEIDDARRLRRWWSRVVGQRI